MKAPGKIYTTLVPGIQVNRAIILAFVVSIVPLATPASITGHRSTIVRIVPPRDGIGAAGCGTVSFSDKRFVRICPGDNTYLRLRVGDRVETFLSDHNLCRWTITVIDSAANVAFTGMMGPEGTC